MFDQDGISQNLRKSVERQVPEVLTRLAPLLDSEATRVNTAIVDLAQWLVHDPDKCCAFVLIAVSTMYQYDVTPGVLREWANAARQADIKAYKNHITDRRVD